MAMPLKTVLGALRSGKTPLHLKKSLESKFGSIEEIQAKIASGVVKSNPPLESYLFLTTPAIKEMLRRGAGKKVKARFKVGGKKIAVTFQNISDAQIFSDKAKKAGWKLEAMTGKMSGVRS